MRDGSSKLGKQGRLSHTEVLSWDLLSKTELMGGPKPFWFTKSFYLPNM